MLTYLIYVTTDIFTVSLVLGVMLSFTDRFFGEKQRMIVRWGLLAGFIAAAARSYITNTQRLVGGWKVGMYGYAAALVFFVIFLVIFFIYMRSRKDMPRVAVSAYAQAPEETSRPWSETALALVMALLITAYLYGALPNVMAYPFKFDIGTSSILSTDFLYRLGGYLLGIIICVTAGYCAYKITTIAAIKGYDSYLIWTFFGLNVLYAVFDFARLMLVLTPRKIVNNHTLFTFAAWSNNHYEYYTYAAFAIVLIMAAMLWIKSLTVQEPYRTKAEHRKQLVLWRNNKRYTVVTVICCIMSVLCATWFVDLNTEKIVEAPVEETEIVKDASGNDETLVVPVEAVEDGHMHRFGYTTDDGHLVRFIIVLKQEGTTNYGVGLDACDICGEAGYFENKEGQIVCKKCNVVMNRTTIGMKGGCNPIIIDYDFDGSKFTVPVSEMIKFKDKFSKQ